MSDDDFFDNEDYLHKNPDNEARLRRRIRVLEAWLTRYQWVEYGYEGHCQWCKEYRTHAPDCELAAALKESSR